MEDGKTSENHLTSPAAFVEGGIQDACDDACSICLEAFCESDPSTVTGCKHEFHLQCILEWCQRSSQCPMCWQLISLKDPSSQELLDAIIQERSIRNKPSRSATIFHPTLGEFELQHLPTGATDAELEERIIQHLAAAAAMGRARHIARRERSRNRSSAQGHPHFLLFTTQANTTSPSRDGGESIPAMAVGSPISSASVPATDISASGSTSSIPAANVHGNISTNRRSTAQSSPSNIDRAGPSELQSFSESWKSRINAMSTRYKESITKSTRGWKERLFSRGPNIADLGPEAGRDDDTSIATVARMMDRLETRETSRDSEAIPNNSLDLGPPPSDQASQQIAESSVNGFVTERNFDATHAASSSLD